jgi:hypothetical protein
MYLVHGCMVCNVVCDKTGIKDRISAFRADNLRSPSNWHGKAWDLRSFETEIWNHAALAVGLGVTVCAITLEMMLIDHLPALASKGDPDISRSAIFRITDLLDHALRKPPMLGTTSQSLDKID